MTDTMTWTAPVPAGVPVPAHASGTRAVPSPADLRAAVRSRAAGGCGVSAAPIRGTGPSIAARSGLLTVAGTTGSATTGAVVGTDIDLTSTIPGELPPGDPLG